MSPDSGSRAHWTLVSTALFILGLAIFGSFGLCTAFMGYFTLLDIAERGDTSGLLLMLILGVLPTAIGATLVYAGLKFRRRH